MIRQSSIRNIAPLLSRFAVNAPVHIALVDVVGHHKELVTAGFSDALLVGERILPAGTFGPVSAFNADGMTVVRKDLPKIRVYHQRIWHHQDWGGHWHDTLIDVPRWQYPRELVPPPSVELELVRGNADALIAAADAVENTPANYERLKHTVNLFLEMFGECELLDTTLAPAATTTIKRLNWKVLPKGRQPWSAVRSQLAGHLKKLSKSNVALVDYRLGLISKAEPDFVAIGEGGFSGYVVFGFPSKHVFLLESIHYGNATYVFDDDWEALSKLTKAEILEGKLLKERVIHRKGWRAAVERLIKP
jgi:hypothetical protein